MPLYLMNFDYLMMILPFMLLAIYSQYKVSSTFAKFSKVNNENGLSGAQIARTILDRNGLADIPVVKVSGSLTDHYDPRKKVVALSESVYNDQSVAAAGVAAHEVGHAIQHAHGYIPLKIRSTIAPVVALTSNFVWIIITLGFMFQMFELVNIAILIFGGTVLFQMITLPVEFNASRRALVQLNDGLISSDEVRGAKQVLNSAALTYVAATLMALVQLVHLFTRTRRNN